jgi:glycoside/pentoside/hexuronide:cation symporter, GPH family
MDARSAADPPPLGFGLRLGYGVGSLAFGISGTVLAGSVLQLYFNQVVGLPAAWVGAAIMLTLMVDSLTDPLIGRFSDNLRTRWGRRHVLMYAAALPAALGVLAMWHAPAGLGPAGLLAFMIGMLLFVRIAVSFYEIPSLALAPELAPNYHDRTALLAWRFMFSVAGAASMSAILYRVFLREDASNPLGVLNRERYADFGGFAAVVAFVVILASTMATHRRIRHLHVAPVRRITLRQAAGELKTILSQRPLQILMSMSLFNGFGGGLYFGLSTYIFLHFWGLKPQDISYVLFVAPLAAFLVVWAAPRLSARFGKRAFLLACCVAWWLVFVTPYLGRLLGFMPTNGSLALVVTLMIAGFCDRGFALGGQVMLNSMLSDASDDAAARTGIRSEGVLFAAYGLLDKWGLGLGALMAGLVLTHVGFPTKALPGAVDAGIINRVVLIAIPTIAAFNMLGVYLVSRFRLDRAQHEQNIAELRRREAARAPN